MDREIELSERRAVMAKRIGIALGAVAVIVATLAFAMSWLRPSIRRVDVRTATVERGDLEVTIEASGTVVPAFEKVISSPVETRVVEVLHQPGATLSEGDEILVLDSAGTRLEIERLDDRIARKTNERDQLRLESSDALADLRSRIEQKELDAEILRFKTKQTRTLSDEGLVSEESFKQAEVAERKVSIELDQLRGSLVSTKHRYESQLSSVEFELALLEKERSAVRVELDRVSTRADRAGVLTWIIQEEGTTVRKGDVIARIADLSSYRVEATVSDFHARRLTVGLPAKVEVGDSVLEGMVASIDPTITNGTIRFHVALGDPSNDRLRTNLRVDVHVVGGERTNVLKVRKGPFLSGAESQDVFVIRDGAALRTAVRFGFAGREGIEIVEGLVEGDEVIVSDMNDYQHLNQMKVK